MTTEEIEQKYQIRRLSIGESVARFDCGDWVSTVDAYRNATQFYIKNGFLPLSTDADTDFTQLLYFDLEEIS